MDDKINGIQEFYETFNLGNIIAHNFTIKLTIVLFLDIILSK